MNKMVVKESISGFLNMTNNHIDYSKKQIQKNSMNRYRLDTELEKYKVCPRITGEGQYCTKMKNFNNSGGFKQGHFSSTGKCLANGKSVYSKLRKCCLDIYGVDVGPNDASICDFYDLDDPNNPNFLWKGCCKLNYSYAILIFVIVLIVTLSIICIWSSFRIIT